MNYLRHITLNTGHDRLSPREEIENLDQVLGLLRPLVEEAIRGERVRIPSVPTECYMTGGADRACVAVTILSSPDHGGGVPIATIAIAGAEACGFDTWWELHMTSDPAITLATAGTSPPPPPWCAARLERGAHFWPETMDWLGDFERCLAWTWLTIITDR